MRREDVVEQRPGAPLPKALHDLGAGHPKAIQDSTGDEGRSIEPHAAMRKNTFAAFNQVCAERRDRFQLSKVGKILVKDREIDVQAASGDGGNAFVETTLEIDH